MSATFEIDPAAYAAIAQRCEPGCSVVARHRFAGGLSSLMTRLDLRRADGSSARVVVRAADPAKNDGQRWGLSIADEFALITALHRRGAPVARPRLVDLDGEVLPFPVMVLDHVEGINPFHTTDPAGTGRAFAEALALVHAIGADDPDVAFLPDRAQRALAYIDTDTLLDEAMRGPEIRDAILRNWPPPQAARGLLHGDFFPGNVLFDGDRLVAIIDWENAQLGDPMSDVACTRLDLFLHFGRAATDAFTERYAEVSGRDVANLVFWDLVAAYGPVNEISTWAADCAAFGRPDLTSARMRADHRAFTDAALARIA